MNDARYRWLILVPRRADAVELFDLDAADRATLTEEIAAASQTLKRLTGSPKINVGALGNLVPQLHVHIVARGPGDPAWPGPGLGPQFRRPLRRREPRRFHRAIRERALTGLARALLLLAQENPLPCCRSRKPPRPTGPRSWARCSARHRRPRRFQLPARHRDARVEPETVSASKHFLRRRAVPVHRADLARHDEDLWRQTRPRRLCRRNHARVGRPLPHGQFGRPPGNSCPAQGSAGLRPDGRRVLAGHPRHAAAIARPRRLRRRALCSAFPRTGRRLPPDQAERQPSGRQRRARLPRRRGREPQGLLSFQRHAQDGARGLQLGAQAAGRQRRPRRHRAPRPRRRLWSTAPPSPRRTRARCSRASRPGARAAASSPAVSATRKRAACRRRPS